MAKYSKYAVFILAGFIFINVFGFLWVSSMNHEHGSCPFSSAGISPCPESLNKIVLTFYHINYLKSITINVQKYNILSLLYLFVLFSAVCFAVFPAQVFAKQIIRNFANKSYGKTNDYIKISIAKTLFHFFKNKKLTPHDFTLGVYNGFPA